MNPARISKLSALLCAIAIVLITIFAFAATTSKTHQLTPGEKAKMSGLIVSRDGDLVRVRDKQSQEVVTIWIGDATKIERKNHKLPFYRHTDMDVTALLPGLTIEAEGVANSKGQLEASKISFTPDDFAIEVAQQQQELANKAAAQNAQSTANEAATAASSAQSSADQAQNSADQASLQAEAAGVVGLADAAAIAAVDQRVSELDDYTIESENDVFFDRDSAVLKKLSEERAAAVARYFSEVQNIPLRRILMPVGYGSTHRLANNTDAVGRELNRRVDVKVLVNKSVEEGL